MQKEQKLYDKRLLKIALRNRNEKFQVKIIKKELDPTKLAIVIMDMWDYHWCRTVRERAAALIPRMNYTLDVARRLGITICFSPTGALRDLIDTQQFRATTNLPYHEMPKAKPLNQHRPRSGSCMCGPGIPCMKHYNRNNQHPDLKMREDDFLVIKTQDMYNLCTKKGINTVILIGIATNMCVLTKPCGILPLKAIGFTVYLGRDLTDACTSFSPGSFNPDEGTQQVISEIEQHLCPSIDLEETFRKAGVWESNEPMDYVNITPWGRKHDDEISNWKVQIEMTLPKNIRTKGAEIRYTLDGSDPTSDSLIYYHRSSSLIERLMLNDSRVVKAAGYKNGKVVTLVSKAEFWKMPSNPPLPDVYISDLKPIQEKTGVTCNKAKMDRSVSGSIMKNRYLSYIKGVGVQTPSELTYELEPNYKWFVASVAVDDIMCALAPPQINMKRLDKISNIIFEIRVDNKCVARGPPMTNGEMPFGFKVEIPINSKRLKLSVFDAENPVSDNNTNGNWLHAGFLVVKDKHFPLRS